MGVGYEKGDKERADAEAATKPQVQDPAKVQEELQKEKDPEADEPESEKEMVKHNIRACYTASCIFGVETATLTADRDHDISFV